MRKRILALALVLCLCLSLGITAFANEDSDEDTSIEEIADDVEIADGEAVASVEEEELDYAEPDAEPEEEPAEEWDEVVTAEEPVNQEDEQPVADGASDTVGDYTYSFGNDTATITKYNGSSTTVNIPETVTYNGYTYKVTGIGGNAFANCTSIQTLIIPASIASIDYYAFGNCTSLSSITINGDIADCTAYSNTNNYAHFSVFYNAGANADSLKVTFGNGVTRIPAYLFATSTSEKNNDYAHVTSVVIADTVTSVGDYAFLHCYDLESVTWGSGLQTIGKWAFGYCDSLTTVVLPKSITSLGEDAFYNCASLQSITINGNLKDLSVGSSVFYNAGADAASLSVTFGDGAKSIPANLFCYAHIKKLTISDSVINIGDYAFYGCYDLESVTWGNGLQTIGNYAFYDCISLTSVELPTSATSLGNYAFYNCTGLCSVIINGNLNKCSGSFPVFYNAGANTDSLIVTFGEKVTSIPAYLFYTPSSSSGTYAHVTKVTIPDSVISIGIEAFYNCSDLSSVTWGSGLESIGSYAFYNDTSLESVDLSRASGLTSIGNNAFQKCTNMTTLVLPALTHSYDSLSLGISAFANCTSLSSITINGDIADCTEESKTNNYDHFSVFYNAGTNADSLKVTFGNGVTRIPAYLFATSTSEKNNDYAHVTSVVIADTVTSVGDYAFLHCYDLESVTWGSGLQTIGKWAFGYCDSLTTVVLPKSITSLGEDAFYNCASLQSITINGDLKDGSTVNGYYPTVFYNAGSNADSLTVTFGNGVKYIPAYLFYTSSSQSDGNYNHITKVTIPGSVVGIGSGAFYNCFDLDSVTYTGTSDQWKNVSISEKNDPLTNASITCTGTYSASAGSSGSHAPGDVNGDGTVNISDVQTLLKYVNGQSVSVVSSSLDVNGDETINISDVQTLLKFVNGQKVTIY